MSISHYDLFTCNIARKNDRGIALYGSTWLKASLLTVNNAILERIWITLNLTGKYKLHIGCLYRSPTSTSANCDTINKQIKESGRNGDALYALILGDFNLSGINWATWISGTNSIVEQEFISTLEDCFLFPHITNPTRGGIEQKPHILDLVITNLEGMIYDLDHRAPLSKSDHAVLSFSLNRCTERQISYCAKRHYARETIRA